MDFTNEHQFLLFKLELALRIEIIKSKYYEKYSCPD